MKHSVSRYPVPKLSELAADMRERIEKVQKKAGFVPNVFLALAHRQTSFAPSLLITTR